MAAEAYLWIVMGGKDDIAGGVAAVGLFFMFVSAVIATAAAIFERLVFSYQPRVKQAAAEAGSPNLTNRVRLTDRNWR